MTRNRRRYSVHEGPLRLDAEHEALYQRYLEVAPGHRASTLAESFLGDQTRDCFDTREIAIHDERGQLVAFSAFDLGVESLLSVMGVYDPVHQRASLGYWSLLLEVEHAVELGLKYHYAGYVFPDGGNMNYKLRVGQIEFLAHLDGSWLPWSERHTVEDPRQHLDRVLEEMQNALNERDMPSRLQSYRWFEAPVWSGVEALLAAPRVLVLGTESAGPLILLTWSFESNCYALVLCQPVVVHRSSHDDVHEEIEMWLVQDQLELSDDASASADRIAEVACSAAK